jgi:membrane protein YdbS with pleckstrin-like domain
MALVACPECQGKVSTAAPRCPHCGHPLGEVAPVTIPFAIPVAPALSNAPAPAAALASPIGPATSLAATFEEVLWQGTPSPKILLLDGLRTALFTTVVIVATVLSYRPTLHILARLSEKSADAVNAYEPGFRLAAVLFVVTVVGLRLLRLGWRALVLRHHHYRLSNQRLTVETGVISKTLSEIDMRAVEDVGLSQSLTERLLQLGRIVIVCSEPGSALAMRGPAKTRLTMIGIAHPREVRETIRGAAYQATRGQLFTRAT